MHKGDIPSMEVEGEKKKRNLIVKTLERCRSMGGSKKGGLLSEGMTRQKKDGLPPVGWFSVYVGDQKERFVIRTMYLNHPVFRALLEEAEMEFGYATDGPLELPCDVDVFRRLLWEVENDADVGPAMATCSSPLWCASRYELLTPGRSFLKAKGGLWRSPSSSLF